MATPRKSQLPEGFTPSRALPDERRERFAQLVVRGKNQLDAYEAAGFVRNSGNSTTMRKAADVSARIAWLLEQAAKVTIYDAAAIKDRLAQHAWNLTEVTVDADGKNIPGPMFSASAGARALELLGREHGMFKERIELGGKVAMANSELFQKMTTDERAAMRTLLVAASARSPQPANENAEEAGVVPADQSEAG